MAKHASEKTNELVVQTPAERLLEAKKLLIKGIDSLTPSDICLSDSKQVQGLQILLVDISRNVNMEHLTSGNVVSMNTFAQKMGENMVAKVIMICIKSFCDSIMVARKMSLPDYMEVASIFLEKHKHESIDDILVALKEAKASGRKDYGGFGSQDVFAIFNAHLEKKIIFRENQHMDRKVQTTDRETGKILATNVDIMDSVKNIRTNQNSEKTVLAEATNTLQTELDDLCRVLPTIDLDILEDHLHACRFGTASFERVCLLRDEIERRITNNPDMISERLKKVEGNNYLLTMKAIEEKQTLARE